MIFFILIFNLAFSQTPTQPKVTSIDFETTDVTGTRHNTKIDIINEKPEPTFTSLIEPRLEFTDELMDSQYEI